MTIIHAQKQKILHFPHPRHESVFKQGIGWLVKPCDEITGLQILNSKDVLDIDITTPQETPHQNSPPATELIHVLP